MKRPNTWGLVWKAWIVFGITYELVTLKVGTPLTDVLRRRILDSPIGSAMTGAFIAWLGYHWLFDLEGLDWWDVGTVLAGIFVGLVGWIWREMNRPPKEEDDG